jgi:DNA-binding Lrp family transcriptional regulator
MLLKYGNTCKAYINYENFIKINQKIPELTDSELGKFYKILTKLTRKANTLLIKNDVKSNPLTKNEISQLINIDIKATERYLKKLKDKNIIKHISIGDKKYFMINPIYAVNGAIISSYTYINFKEEIEELSNIPEELKTLWEYEFINSNIEDA